MTNVTNIYEYLNNNMDVIEFKNYVVHYVMKCFGEKELEEIDKSILTRSGFMVGFGEIEEEVIELLKDL